MARLLMDTTLGDPGYGQRSASSIKRRSDMNSRRNSGMVKMAVIALLLALTYSSEAFALKYVIPFPSNKREAMAFVVHEKKSGVFHFRLIIDEKKLGSQVPGFMVMAYPTPREGQPARGVEFTSALFRDQNGKLHATFVLDKELAYVGYVELAVAPLPPETREVPGGTFYAFKIGDFVEFGPDAISEAEMQSRIEALSATGRFLEGKDASPSVENALPVKVRPIVEQD